MKTLYYRLGLLFFPLLLPIMRPILRRTRRVYGAVIYENKVILVKNWLARDTWRLPGGGVKKDEDPTVALSREISEELGIEITPEKWVHLHADTMKTERLGFYFDVYYVKLDMPIELKPDQLEIMKTGFFTDPPGITQDEYIEVFKLMKSRRLL